MFSYVSCPLMLQVVVIVVYVYLYSQVYLILCGLQFEIQKQILMTGNSAVSVVMGSQSIVHLGLLMVMPMFIELGLERGFDRAVGHLLMMHFQFCSVFFTFSLGTKFHYLGRTILHGGAKYRPTGRGFVVRHTKFAENYRTYSRSHFVKGLEILLLLIIYQIYDDTGSGLTALKILTSSHWFIVFSWIYAPFLFNPSGFEWQKTTDGWNDWRKWIYQHWWGLCRG